MAFFEHSGYDLASPTRGLAPLWSALIACIYERPDVSKHINKSPIDPRREAERGTAGMDMR